MYQLTWKNKNSYADQEEVILLNDSVIDDPIERVLPLYWEEHCVECAIPFCYSSCPLYNKRKDQKCARFTYGIFPNNNTSGLLEFGADINFERWAKLESYWSQSPRMLSKESINFENKVIQSINSFADFFSSLFFIIDSKRNISRFCEWLIERWIRFRIKDSRKLYQPDGLFIKFYYPGETERELQLEILGDDPFFRANIPVKHGWNTQFIHYSEIKSSFLGIGRIRVWPSNDQPMRLIFTWLDLVIFQKDRPAKKVKCVCWDLDNTLWDGVIGDDGESGVKPNPKILTLIKELDDRGILQSIVSKNDFDLAWKKIDALGLSDYFLYPAIHWGPKSESIKKIASELNISVNSFAVIDDSAWERDEIQSALPGVRAYDPVNILNILAKDEFVQPVTNETRARRKMYSTEASRKSLSINWGDNIDGFLKNCQMEMIIKHPSDSEKERCLELLQRSNQFNLSGKSYTKELFDTLVDSPMNEPLCISLKDKFGDYGIIMFAVIEHKSDHSSIIDFAMSCRVAKKLVDEIFFQWSASYIKRLGKTKLRMNLSITGRNKPLIDSLENLPFIKRGQDNGSHTIFEISLSDEALISDVIKINSEL